MTLYTTSFDIGPDSLELFEYVTGVSFLNRVELQHTILCDN